MRIIIVGCGRLGSGLALSLIEDGNQVTVISDDPSNFKRLGENFPGATIAGKEFDKEVLEKANIERADSLISCTDGDAKNALVARIARNYYRVPKVVARLYDLRKVEIYNALGIQVIATTKWGIDKAKKLLTFDKMENLISIGNTPVEVIKVFIPELLIGYKLKTVFPTNTVKAIAIIRGNKSFIPSGETILHKNDTLVVAVMAEDIKEVSKSLGI